MSSREANIEKLNYAITNLSEDAEGVHALISKSVDELENATTAGNKAAENAAKMIELLSPLTEQLSEQHKNSAAMLDEAKKASDEQRKITTEQIEALKGAVGETLESVSAKTEATCAELRRAQDEAFDEMQAKASKEHERIRDDLQTDLLNFKNSTTARLDSIEAELVKTESAVESCNNKISENADAVTTKLEGEISESANAMGKKLLVPIYAAIGMGAINLICLVMLLLR